LRTPLPRKLHSAGCDREYVGTRVFQRWYRAARPYLNFGVFLLGLTGALCAQSISITSPTGGQTISGTSVPLTVSITSMPGVYSVAYYFNAIQDSVHTACISRSAPWSCNWNSNYVFGGPYVSLIAVGRDALNNTLATSSAVTFRVANTLPVPSSVFSWTISASSSPWSGSKTIAPTYTGSDSSHGSINCFVDGQLQSGATINSATFENATHYVRCNGLDGNAPHGGWNEAAEWEQPIVFSNGATPYELRLQPGYEGFICPTSSASCNTSITVTGKVYNTDGTSSAATFSSVSIGGLSYPTAPVTVSGCSSCTSVTITAQAVGTVPITFTESGGHTRVFWANVNSSNVLPHFGTDGKIYNTFTSGKSFLSFSLFSSAGNYLNDNAVNNSGQPLLTSPFYPNFTSMAQDMFDSGINTAEFALQTPSGLGAANSSAYQTALASLVAQNNTFFQSYRLYSNYVGDNFVRGTPNLFPTTQGPTASWTPPAVQSAIASLVGQNVIAVHMCDECNTAFSDMPLGTVNWSNGLSALSCTSGSNCTVTCTPYVQSPGLALTQGCPLAANGTIIVTGSGDSNMDYNTTSGAPSPYNTSNRVAATNGGYSSYTFPTPSGVGTKTYTSGANPGLTINFQVPWTYDSSGNACPPGGSSSGPCTNWTRNNSFAQIMSQYFAATGYPTPIWDVAGQRNTAATQNWSDPAMSGGSMMYYAGIPNNPASFMAGAAAVWDFSQSQTSTGIAYSFRNDYAALGATRLAPIAGEANGGVTTDYSFQGYPVTVTSCAGNLITFSAPHGVANIIPWDTRLSISGNSNANCNTNFFVIDAPTPTTLHVAVATWTFAASYSAGTFTATADTGATFTLSSISSATNGPFSGGHVQAPSGPCVYENYRGHTFTVSGTGTTFDSTTIYMIPAPYGAGGCGSTSSDGVIGQVPALASGTGGTATIVLNQGYTRGVNWIAISSEAGPRYAFASPVLNALLGAAQLRLYFGQVYQDNPQSHSTGTFNDTSYGTLQAGVHPRYGQYAKAQLTWEGNTMAAKLLQRLTPCLFEPRSSAPDYGEFFESTVRLSSICNLLMVQSLADAPLTRTVDLTPIAVSGQATTKYCAGQTAISVSTIASGTTSDTNTFDPDACAVAAYVATPNGATWYSPPVISARLADVPNATSIAIEWTYSPLQFGAPQLNGQALFQSYSLGAGTGTAPIDRQIGKVRYRLIYLGTGSTILATSDVQTF
jgi:hypothetical protein